MSNAAHTVVVNMAHLRVSAGFLPHQCGSFSCSRKDSCFRNHTGDSCTYHRAGDSPTSPTFIAGHSPTVGEIEYVFIFASSWRFTSIASAGYSVPQRDMSQQDTRNFVPREILSHSGTRPTLTSHTLSLRGTCPARDTAIFRTKPDSL